jgi:hypothetical protein
MINNKPIVLNFDVPINQKSVLAFLFSFLLFMLVTALGSESIKVNTYYPVSYGTGFERVFVGSKLDVGSRRITLESPQAGIVIGGITYHGEFIRTKDFVLDLRASGGNGISFEEMRLGFPESARSSSYQARLTNFCKWQPSATGTGCPVGYGILSTRYNDGAGHYDYSYDNHGFGANPNEVLCCRFSFF